MNTLKFLLNEPHIVKLLDTTADADGSNWVYSLEGGQSMSLPRVAALKLNSLFPEVGEELSIGRYRTKDDQPAEWVVSLTARSEQARADKEIAAEEKKARELAAQTRRDLPAQLVASVRELKPTGTSGPFPLQMPKIAAKAGRQMGPPPVSYRVALREITGTVLDLLEERREQWDSDPRQGLISTLLISACKAGMVTFDFQPESEARP